MRADVEAQAQRPRFLTDMNFNGRIVLGLRRIIPTIDLITAQEAGFQRLSDSELLAESARLDRILLTHDINTMPGYYTTFLASLH